MSAISGWTGTSAPNTGTEVGKPRNRLERVAALHPGVVATVQESHVLDAAVRQDERGAGGGDLAGTTSGPLLVRLTFGVAAVEDHGRVARDPERPQSRVEILRGAPIPVARALELVRVQVERAREVAIGVFLGNAEVDVEEEVPAPGAASGWPPPSSSQSQS